MPDHEFLAGGQFLVMNGLGIDDSDFYNALMTQLAAACVVNGKIDENALNDTLSMIKSNGPRMQDWTELCKAMAAVLRKNMALALILVSSKNRQQQDRVKRLFVKSTGTFIAQLECLKSRRTVGVSRVRMQKGSGRKQHAGGPRR